MFRGPKRIRPALLSTPRALFAALLLALGAAGCLNTTGPSPIAIEDDKFADELNVDLDKMTKTESGLYIQDLVPGEGAVVAVGDSIAAHYTGWLTNGRPFDSSKGYPPIVLKLTVQNVIPGWVEGLQGMQVGGKRKLVIPSYLAYGAYGDSRIPAYSNLIFDVELVSIFASAEKAEE